MTPDSALREETKVSSLPPSKHKFSLWSVTVKKSSDFPDLKTKGVPFDILARKLFHYFVDTNVLSVLLRPSTPGDPDGDFHNGAFYVRLHLCRSTLVGHGPGLGPMTREGRRNL